MKRTLLLSLLMTLTWAARAVDVTFVAPEGYRLGSVVVDGDYLEGFYDEASGQTTYGTDLTPGEHRVQADLDRIYDQGVVSWGTGAEKTFTVGYDAMTVTYGPENFVELNFTATDESGNPLPYLSVEITRDGQYVTGCGTDEYGKAQAHVPADLGAFTYTADNSHYAPLSATAEAKGNATMNLVVSYADYRRVTLSVPAFDFSSGNWLEFGLSGTENETASVGFTESVHSDGEEMYFVVPQGNYNCQVIERTPDNTVTRVAQQQLTVGEDPVNASLDLSGGVLFTVNCSDITTSTFTLYLMPEDGTSHSEAFVCAGPIMLPQGKYRLYGELYGDDGNTYSLNRPVDLTDGPVSLTLERAQFHRLQFTLSGLDGTEDLWVALSYDLGDGFYASSGDNVYYWGDYTYMIQGVVWIDDEGYALPSGLNGGRITVGESDVNVTVDMSGLRTFKAALPESLESVREVWFTRTDGARGRLSFVSRGMGIALPVGTYTVTGETNDYQYQLVSCTLTVPADCPESLLLNFSGSSTGIHSAAQAQGPTARAEAGGLRIAAPQGGRVSVSVFDLSGRRVLTAQAGDGEVVSTAALVPGVYVARLGAGSAAATVKFVVR